MKYIVEFFGDDRNGRKMIAWGRRIGCADAGNVFSQSVGKLPKLFVRPFIHPADLIYYFPSC